MPVTPPMVRNLVPMLHVASVPRAAAFYARLGFAIAHTHHEPDHGDAPVWAWLHSPGGADLMLALADTPVDPAAQGALFYLYCDDVDEMHAALHAAGVAVGEITMPFYCPTGEFRVTDPDGYVSMVTNT